MKNFEIIVTYDYDYNYKTEIYLSHKKSNRFPLRFIKKLIKKYDELKESGTINYYKIYVKEY